MKIKSVFSLAVMLVLFSNLVFADPKVIVDNLSKAIPGLIIKTVEETKMPGIFEVVTDSGEVLFTSQDARFFLTGDMYSTQNNNLVNLSEERRTKERVAKIDQIDPIQKVIFPAKGELKGKITVFTDIDCGYCRKLHYEVPELNEMGIEVSYLAYPRAGVGSESFNKYVSVWCADDKLSAMTKAKNGKSISSKQCENPIESQFNLGREIGISGTPAIILQDGSLIPGYINAQRIAQALGVK